VLATFFGLSAGGEGCGFVCGESNTLISIQGGGPAACCDSWGGGAPLLATLAAILEMSPERGAMWRVGGPRIRERHAEWWVGGPRARERRPTAKVARPSRVGLLRTWCFSCCWAVGLGAAALRHWVLHGRWPSRCVGVRPSVSLSTLDHF
jgi:hypothetical protein